MATSSLGSNGTRTRSLYWRAVMGFSACIAAVLAIQATAIVVYVKREPDTQQLRAFTRAVADDLAQAASVDSHLDIQRYIDEHYPSPFASIFITTADAKTILRGPLRPPESTMEGAREFYRLNPGLTALPE